MTANKFEFKMAILPFAIASCFAGYAQAQNAKPEKKESIIEYVYVTADPSYLAKESKTASRINVSLQEIPINVQAVTGEVIKDFQLVTQRDALQMHASVDGKSVRGFSTSEFFRNGFLHLSDSPGFTIERVEVVRGPNAILNGPVTPGGAINTITKHATIGGDALEIGGYAGTSDSTGVGNRQNVGLDIDYHNTNEEGTLAFRFVGGFQHDTGFGSPVDNDMKAILPSVQWSPSDKTVVDFEYYNYAVNTDRADRAMGIEMTIPMESNGQTIQVPVAQAFNQIEPLDSFFQGGTNIEESLSDWTLKINHEFTDQLLLSIGFNNHNRDFEFGPGNRPLLGTGSGPGAFTFFWQTTGPATNPTFGDTLDPADYTLSRRNEQLSLQNAVENTNIQLTYLIDPEHNHKLVVGMDKFDQAQTLQIARYRSSFDAMGNFVGAGLGDRTAQTFTLTSLAGIQAPWNPAAHGYAPDIQLHRDRWVSQSNLFINYHGSFINNQLNILLGYNANDIQLTENTWNSGCIDADPTCGGPTPAASDRTIFDDSEALPQAGVVYYIDPDQTYGVYGNYSRSQLPDLNDPDFDADPPLREGEQTEVGFKFNGLLDGSLNINLGYYQITQDTTAENDVSREADAEGIDLDISWLPNDQTSILFSMASLDSEVTASTDPDEIGRPLLDEVDLKMSLWGKYEFDEGVFSNVSVGGGFVYTGEKVRRARFPKNEWLIFENQVLTYDPTTRLDLFAQYEGDDYEVSLNLRNLTKEDNLSANVPRLPLQGGYDANGDPFTFDGEMEIMLGFRYFIK